MFASSNFSFLVLYAEVSSFDGTCANEERIRAKKTTISKGVILIFCLLINCSRSRLRFYLHSPRKRLHGTKGNSVQTFLPCVSIAPSLYRSDTFSDIALPVH